jgi:hypothetical protein
MNSGYLVAIALLFIAATIVYFKVKVQIRRNNKESD